jgi:hypothetical protein
MKKSADCPGKNLEAAPESKKLTQRFAEYNQNAVNSDDIEGSHYEGGRPGGGG